MPRPVAWQTMFISIAIERSKLWFHEPNKTWQTNRVSFACPEGAQTFFVGAHESGNNCNNYSTEVQKSNFRQYGPNGKSKVGRVREERKEEERGSEKRKSQKKEDASAGKGKKVAKHCVFRMICGSGGSKSRFAKGAGAAPSGQMREKISRRCGAKHVKSKSPLLEVEMSNIWAPLWREAHFQVKMYKAHQGRSTFGSCPKSVRRCGAKHISKSKRTKHTRIGARLEVEMSKKWSPLWREAHFQLKMYKTPQSENFWKLTCRKKCTPLWREAHVQVKMCK